MRMKKHLKEALAPFLDQGWWVERVKHGSHIKVYSPDNKLRVVAGACTGDTRSLNNFKANLKRAKKEYENTNTGTCSSAEE
jgi:predicted RNA binding protein YcfA (HicA-like mRNA interferase family)